MQTTVIDSALLSRILKTAAVCGDEIQVHTDGAGWHVVSADPSHTSMTASEVPASCFAEYAEQGTFRFRTGALDLILKRKGDVELAVGDGSLRASSGTLSRTVPLFVPETVPGYPSFGHDDLATFEVAMIRDAVMAFDPSRTPFLRVSADDGGMAFTAGEDRDTVRADVPSSECLEWERAAPGTTRVTLDLGMAQSLLRSLPRDAIVTWMVATDRPASVRSASGGAVFDWVCAPVLEDA